MKIFARVITAVSVLFCCSLAVAGPPGFFPFEPDDEMRTLIGEATALALIDNLALAPDQRTEIKRILSPVHEEIGRMKEEEKQFRDDRIKPRLRQVIQDLKAGRDPASSSPEDVVAQMTAVRTRIAALFTMSNQAYGEIQGVLTPAQQERLRSFRFEEYIGPMPGMHPRKMLGMDPVKLIEEIRNSSQEEIDAMVLQIEQGREARKAFAGKAGRGAARDRKVQVFMDLVQEIHAMPQSEFDARTEQLKKEIEAVTPGRRPGGGPGSKSPERSPFMNSGAEGRPSPPMGKGFDVKRIIFSEPFYEAL
jgi:hypothetical protein